MVITQYEPAAIALEAYGLIAVCASASFAPDHSGWEVFVLAGTFVKPPRGRSCGNVPSTGRLVLPRMYVGSPDRPVQEYN